MKIAMIGLGAVAMADALALGREHQVVLTGPVPDLVDQINAGDYRLVDASLDAYRMAHPVRLRATLDTRAALDGADMVLVSAPLSCDPETGLLNIVELESRIELAARLLPHVPIAIRSAVPVGFTDMMRQRLNSVKLVYAPEFSRKGHALQDVLHPPVRIVGDRGRAGLAVAQVLASGALTHTARLRQMDPSEAEALRHVAFLFRETSAAYFPTDAGMTQDAAAPTPPAGRGRIAMLADHSRAHGAHRVAIYLSTLPTRTSSALASLHDMLRAVGLNLQTHTGGTDGLDQFQTSGDVTVAPSMTTDLRDIATKIIAQRRCAIA